jgi:hypothetical protein
MGVNLTTVYVLMEEQPDERILAGTPTRLLGFFSTELLAQRYVEEILAQASDTRGNLEVYPYEVDEVSWTDGFVTERPKKKKKRKRKE